jgi:hypothetical protein
MKLNWFSVHFCCLFVPDTNPHFWSKLHQTLYTSAPWSGGRHRVCMDLQYCTFPTVFNLFCHERVPNAVQKIAAGSRIFPQSVISVIPEHVRVMSQVWCSYCMSHALWVVHRKCEEHYDTHVSTCRNLIILWGSEQWIAIAFAIIHITILLKILTYNVPHLHLSFFPVLSTDNTLCHLLRLHIMSPSPPLSALPATYFPCQMTTQTCQPTQSHACLCR